MPLNDKYKSQLANIIRGMEADGYESDRIKSVVSTFSTKYEPFSDAETLWSEQPELADKISKVSSPSRKNLAEVGDVYDNFKKTSKPYRESFLNAVKEIKPQEPVQEPVSQSAQMGMTGGGNILAQRIQQQEADQQREIDLQSKLDNVKGGELPEFKYQFGQGEKVGTSSQAEKTAQEVEEDKERIKKSREFFGAHPEVKQFYDGIIANQEALTQGFEKINTQKQELQQALDGATGERKEQIQKAIDELSGHEENYKDLFNFASKQMDLKTLERFSQAKERESVVKSLYLFNRAAYEKGTFGLGRLVTPLLEYKALGDSRVEGEGRLARQVKAETPVEQMSEALGGTAGTFMGGGTVAGGVAGSGIVENIGSELLKQAVVRGSTSLAISIPNAISGVVAGDITAKDGVANVVQSTIGSLVAILPETYIPVGLGNFVGQVAVDFAYDYGSDKLLGRMENKTFKDWFVENLPNMGLSMTFAARDFADSNFKYQQARMKGDVTKANKLLKNFLKKKFGKDFKESIEKMENKLTPVEVTDPELQKLLDIKAQESKVETNEKITETDQQEVITKQDEGIQKVSEVEPKVDSTQETPRPIDEPVQRIEEPVRPQEEPIKPIEEKPLEQERSDIEKQLEQEGDIVGQTHAEAERIAKINGYELTPKETISWAQNIANAKEQGLNTKALGIAEDVLDAKGTKTLNSDEKAGLLLKKTELRNVRRQTMKELDKAIADNDKEGIKKHSKQFNYHNEEMKLLEDAAKMGSSEGARALNFQKAMMDVDKYELVTVLERAKVIAKGNLKPSREKKITEAWKKNDKVVENIDSKLEEISKNAEQMARENTKKFFDEVSKEVITERQKADLAIEREQIKEQLRAMGLKVNDITGVTGEGAWLLTKLAKNYIQSGAKNVESLIDQLKADLPEMSERDISQSLSTKTNAETKKIAKEKRKEKKELESQVKQMESLDKVLDDIDRDGVTMALLKKARNKISKIINSVKKTEPKLDADDKRLYKFVDKLMEVDKQIEEGWRPLKKQRKIDRPDIAEIRKKLDFSRRKQRLIDQITDINEQERTGLFKVPAKRQKLALTEELRDLQAQKRKSERRLEEAIYQANPLWKKVLHEMWETPRSTLLTADISYTFRQGARLGVAHPIIGVTAAYGAAKSGIDALVHGAKGMTADKIMANLEETKDFKDWKKYGGEEEEFGGGGSGSELFKTHIVQKIPVIGRPMVASDRHMAVGLNLLRVGSFNAYRKNNPLASDAELSAYVQSTNRASGKGGFKGKAGVALNGLSKVFLAPKFVLSRVQDPLTVLNPANGVPKKVRIQVAKEWGIAAGGLMAALSIGHISGLWEVETDPYSPDFGKARVGDEVYDPWASYLQIPRTMLRLGLMRFQEDKRKKPMSELADLAIYKLHPSIGFTVEGITGKNIWNKDTTVLDTFYQNLTPINTQTAIQFATSDTTPLWRKFVGTGLESAGVGVSIYPKRSSAKKEGSSSRKRRTIIRK